MESFRLRQQAKACLQSAGPDSPSAPSFRHLHALPYTLLLSGVQRHSRACPGHPLRVDQHAARHLWPRRQLPHPRGRGDGAFPDGIVTKSRVKFVSKSCRDHRRGARLVPGTPPPRSCFRPVWVEILHQSCPGSRQPHSDWNSARLRL